MLIYLQIIETDEDKSKFEQIYEAYRGLMFHAAFKVLTHEQDAEDAVHGILSQSLKQAVYVAFELDHKALTSEEVAEIANSIEFK